MIFTADFVLPAQGSPIVSLQVSPSRKVIASAGADKTAKLYDSTTGEVIRVIDGEHIGGLNDCAWITDQCLVTAGDDGAIKLMDLEKEKCVAVFQAQLPNAFPYCLTIQPRSRVITAGYTNGSVLSYHPSSKTPLHQLLAHGMSVTSVSYAGDGEELLTASHDGTVRKWVPSHTLLCTRTIVPAAYSPVCRVSAVGDRYLLASTLDSCHRLFRMEHAGDPCVPSHIRQYQGHSNTKHSVFAAVHTGQRGSLLFGGGDDGKMTVWDVNTAQVKAQFQAHPGPLLAGAVTEEDGDLRVFTAGMDGGMTCWKAGEGTGSGMEEEKMMLE